MISLLGFWNVFLTKTIYGNFKLEATRDELLLPGILCEAGKYLFLTCTIGFIFINNFNPDKEINWNI